MEQERLPMDSKYFVIDANVPFEYIFDREHKEKTIRLLRRAANEEILLIAPSILGDEMANVFHNCFEDTNDIQKHMAFMEELTESQIITVVMPKKSTYMKAIDICRDGNEKSGFPEFSDSIYHALAIENDAIFITNDRKHYLKAKQFGHIELLKEIII